MGKENCYQRKHSVSLSLLEPTGWGSKRGWWAVHPITGNNAASWWEIGKHWLSQMTSICLLLSAFAGDLKLSQITRYCYKVCCSCSLLSFETMYKLQVSNCWSFKTLNSTWVLLWRLLSNVASPQIHVRSELPLSVVSQWRLRMDQLAVGAVCACIFLDLENTFDGACKDE